MKRPFEATAMLALACLIATPASAVTDEGWPRCRGDDACPGFYLNVMTRQGDAKLSVGRSCLGQWRHVWGESDARRTSRQWFNEDAAYGQGRLCIRLDGRVDQIRITSIGCTCGFHSRNMITSASEPGGNIVLRRSSEGSAVVVLSGCHATIGNDASDEVAHGGIALNFSDGYGFGDAYVSDTFYGVYDGFGQGVVTPMDATVHAIGAFGTYHYTVEILADGQSDEGWTEPASITREAAP